AGGVAPYQRVFRTDGGQPGAGLRHPAGHAAPGRAARTDPDVLRRRGGAAGRGVRASAAAAATPHRPSRGAGHLGGQGHHRVAGPGGCDKARPGAYHPGMTGTLSRSRVPDPASMADSTGSDFGTLLQQHRGIVLKVANSYAYGTEDRADLAQDIAAQLWRAWPAYDPS